MAPKAKNATRRKVPRECVACLARQPEFYGIPDPCLPTLPGVANACCGHGCEQQAYVHFEGDPQVLRVIRGQDARVWQIEHGGQPAPFTRKTLRYEEQDWDTFQGWRKIHG